ncbi:MAG: DUF1905 domain-containing protein [Actinobacteria bacterium]|nr:DUF1905 domain-containing protein [Actinomycetota bacterium]
MKFTTTLQLDGKTATGIRVPEQVVAALGGGKRIPVSVTINGTRYASTVATMRGEPKIPVSAGIRSAAGIAAGDTITVDVERDDTPRTVDIPAELAAALRADPAAAERFAALSYSNQRRHVLSVTGARTAETRTRRVQRVLEELRPN